MIKYLKLAMVLGCVFSNMLFAEESKSSLEARAIMDGVNSSFVKVMPFVYSDDKTASELFNSEKERKELVKNLEDISLFFKSAKHVEFFQRPGFRPSLETINVHLDDTIRSVKDGSFKFSQKRLKAMTGLCMSCHTQLSDDVAKNAFGDKVVKLKELKNQPVFGIANYLYLMRRFDDAKTNYEKAIDVAIKNKNESEQASSLRKLISIDTKIDFNYKNAQKTIAKYQKKKNLSPFAKNLLKAWEKDLATWKGFDGKGPVDVKNFIQTYLVKPNSTEVLDNDITLLVSSGVISKFLTEPTNKEDVPMALYWLAVSDKKLSETYLYSLSDLYLKDCIKLYPASDYAKKCYSEYEESIEFGYSGSGGTDIPKEEKQELERLKRLLK